MRAAVVIRNQTEQTHFDVKVPPTGNKLSCNSETKLFVAHVGRDDRKFVQFDLILSCDRFIDHTFENGGCIQWKILEHHQRFCLITSG